MIKGIFKIRSHIQGPSGPEHDLSKYVMDLNRSKTLNGSSEGSWSVTLKLPVGDPMLSVLRGYIRDDDWVKVGLNEGRDMIGLVNEVTESRGVDVRTGSNTVEFSIRGSDWSKCMTKTQIRTSALFSSLVTIPQGYLGNYPLATKSGTLSVENDLLPGAFTPEGQEVSTEDDAAVSEGVYVPTGNLIWKLQPKKIPGFIDERNWDELHSWVYLGGAKPAQSNAAVALTNILRVVLAGLWRDPAGITLINKLSNKSGQWPRVDVIRGYAWRLVNMIQQPVITPDQIMRTYGNQAFNEVFYDYDSQGNPAMVFRERPFSIGAWRALPVTTITKGELFQNYSLTRSGAERMNYWNPQTVLVNIPGVERIVDTREGRMPIVDFESIADHGVRPGEPQDDYWPPSMKETKPVLEWFRNRISKFRSWYFNNAEFYTGRFQLKRARPDIQVGTRVALEVPAYFNVGGTPRLETNCTGYVTGVHDRVTRDPSNGSILSSTAVDVIRIQPTGGLPVDPEWSWIEGD